MKLQLQLAFAWALVLTAPLCSLAQEQVDRPMEMWVFRSVLDGQPRMVTAALNKNLYVAYDTKFCHLHKAWDGGVRFQGPVYNKKHGPQPVTKGGTYSKGPEAEQVWFVKKGERNYVPVDSMQFKGYRWKDNKVSFKYLLFVDGKAFEVWETPEFRRHKKGYVGLEQRFRTENKDKSLKIALLVTAQNLNKTKKDLDTNGELVTLSEKETITEDGDERYAFEGMLELSNEDGETLLTTYYAAY